MRNFIAISVVVMTMAAAGLAQQGSLVNRPALQAAIAASGATAGYLPIFTNTAGDLGNSAVFQVNNGNGTFNLGVGTAAPEFNFHFVSQVDPASVTVDGYGIVGINFIGRRARGTIASPSAVLAGDNLMTIQGRGYGTTGFSGTSRANIKFFAAENWTDAAQGGYVTVATTPAGSNANATERLRITDAGRIGIGTTTPVYPLSVNGVIQSLTGGFRFPDGTTQTTAAVGGGGGGVTITSPDNSITVGGTATAPTLKINQTGPNGALRVPVVVANTSFTGSFGLGPTNTIYTAAADGFYRVSVYMNVTTAGTCAGPPCQGESVTVQWNDGISTTALATANCNLVTVCGASSVTPVWVKSGQAITAYGQSYGTGVAPGGSPVYKAYVLVEQL